jgi:hypothetical protein
MQLLKSPSFPFVKKKQIANKKGTFLKTPVTFYKGPRITYS